MSDWREWAEAIALCAKGPETGCEFALIDAHKDFIILRSVARAAKNAIGLYPERGAFDRVREALKEVEHLL